MFSGGWSVPQLPTDVSTSPRQSPLSRSDPIDCEPSAPQPADGQSVAFCGGWAAPPLDAEAEQQLDSDLQTPQRQTCRADGSTPRSRGRPPGTFGSRSYRAHLKTLHSPPISAGSPRAESSAFNSPSPAPKRLRKGLEQCGTLALVPWAPRLLVPFGHQTAQIKLLHQLSVGISCGTAAVHRGRDARTQHVYSRLAQFHLGEHKRHLLLGIRAQAERVGVKSSSHLAEKVELLGAMAFFCSMLFVSSAMSHLIGEIDSKRLKPIVLIVFMASDATPLHLAKPRPKGGQAAAAAKLTSATAQRTHKKQQRSSRQR